MVVETKKILGPRSRVPRDLRALPTFIGHAEAVNRELERAASTRTEAAPRAGCRTGSAGDRSAATRGYNHAAGSHGQDGVFVSRCAHRSDLVETGFDVGWSPTTCEKGAR